MKSASTVYLVFTNSKNLAGFFNNGLLPPPKPRQNFTFQARKRKEKGKWEKKGKRTENKRAKVSYNTHATCTV